MQPGLHKDRIRPPPPIHQEEHGNRSLNRDPSPPPPELPEGIGAQMRRQSPIKSTRINLNQDPTMKHYNYKQNLAQDGTHS